MNTIDRYPAFVGVATSTSRKTEAGRKKINVYFFMLVFCLLQPVCVSAWELIDHAGRHVILQKLPESVVSLAPSLTELVYLVGKEEILKGATEYSDYPAAAKKLPRVGSYVRLDLEKIVALKPDLCLAVKDGNPRHIVEKLTDLGIPVYVVDPRKLADIPSTIEEIGKLLGAENRAEKVAASIRHRIAAVSERTSQAETRPLVFFQVDAAPIVAVGSNSFINELIEVAGGVNLTAGDVPYPRYSWEDVLVLRPEVVVTTSMAGGYTPEALLAEWHRWTQLPAVRDNRVYVVDAGFFDRPTDRLITGLEKLARIIHPELYAK